MPRPVYDTATRKVVMKEGEKGTTPKEGERTWFQVSGEVRSVILEFAKEDGIDVSTKAGQGRAINAYIRAWVAQGLAERQKSGEPASGVEVPTPAPTSSDGPAAEQPRGSGGRFAKRR